MASTPRCVNGYQILEKLGAGLQGKVYKGISPTSEIVALKFIAQSSVGANPRAFANLQREISAMQLVAGHPHTVSVKEVLLDVSKPKKRQIGQFVKCILLVLEICSGGELFDYLMHTSKFSELTCRTYWRQMCEALFYAHSRNVFHRDLKPENLLLDSQFNLRVADWGLSAVQADSDSAVLRTQCGTKAYMAPELLRRELYRGETADVWSAGVVLFIMLAGFPPFQQASPGDWWFDRIKAGQHALFWQAHERSAAFSAEAKDLLNSIFNADPARRYRVDDCLKHPWSSQDTMTPSVLYEDMRARRLVVLSAKGQAVPTDADETMTGGTTEVGGMSIASGSDVFAQSVVRSVDAIELPPNNPVMPSTMRNNPARAKAAASALASVLRTGPLGALSPETIIEPLPPGYSFTSKVTWMFIKAGVSPFQIAQAVMDYVATKDGVVRPKLRAGPDYITSVKLKVSFGSLLGWEIRLFDVNHLAGVKESCIPIGTSLLVDVTRVMGDSLGSNIEFSKLARALHNLMLPVDWKDTDASLDLPMSGGEACQIPNLQGLCDSRAATATESVFPLAVSSILTIRERTIFASDTLQLL